MNFVVFFFALKFVVYCLEFIFAATEKSRHIIRFKMKYKNNKVGSGSLKNILIERTTKTKTVARSIKEINVDWKFYFYDFPWRCSQEIGRHQH